MASKRDGGEIGVLFLAFVGAIALGGAIVAAGLFGLLRVATLGEDDPDGFLALPSPDGAMKAVQITWSGGAISGHCESAVAVTPAAARNEDAAKPEFLVFSAPCASFALRDGTMASSPAVRWLSAERLRITFSTTSMRGEVETLRLRSLDASRKITIEFVASD